MKTFRLPASGIIAAIILFTTLSCSDDHHDPLQVPEVRTATFLAVNDLHANLENFPRLAYIADSLREIYPELIVVSAGDNQTGHPANDQYIPRGLPVIELMNAVGFNLSAVGNHEFDTGQEGFSLLTRKADFDFLCSNIDVPSEFPFNIKPYKVISTKEGLKIGVASLLQLGQNGLPDCYPEYTRGFTFYNPFQSARKYTGMKDSCDLLVFVNHLGYTDDIALAEQFPAGTIDVILGGHSHTMLEQKEMHNGTLITQAGDKLEHAVLVEISVKSGGGTDSRMEVITIDKKGKKDAETENMVRKYLDNPAMQEPIATLQTPITSKEQLGYLMADAMHDAIETDFSLVNAGGVRSSSWNSDVVTPYDVYKLDPFGNTIITVNFSGAELHDFFIKGYYESKYHWIYTSGLKAEYTVKDDELLDIRLFTPDGKALEKDRTYKVSMNNYMISAMIIPHQDKEVNSYIPTAENMISYLKKIKTVQNYSNGERLTILRK